MSTGSDRRAIGREQLGRFAALGVLLILGGLALAGPYGLLAWGESGALLDKRQHQIAMLRAETGELDNLVERLDPEHVDPDLATELVRKNLNVAHPDEYVIEIEPAR